MYDDRVANRCQHEDGDKGRCNLNLGHNGEHQRLTMTPHPHTVKWVHSRALAANAPVLVR
jgi:hypothetical protein